MRPQWNNNSEDAECYQIFIDPKINAKLKQNIIESAVTPWGENIVVVKKKIVR